MEIPGLGQVTKDGPWYRSKPIAVPVLGGKPRQILVSGYDEDSAKEDFHAAIANFLSIGPEVLKEAEEHIFQYYKDIKAEREEDEDDDEEKFESAADVWSQVRLAKEPLIKRRAFGDRGIYVSLECGCDWEEEHGLQIVLKNGRKVNKVGAYNGHLTNSDAYNDGSLEDVIYHR